MKLIKRVWGGVLKRNKTYNYTLTIKNQPINLHLESTININVYGIRAKVFKGFRI